MRLLHATALGTSLVLFTACGAELKTRRLPANELDKANGLVVNHNEPHELIAVFPESVGSSKLVEKWTSAFITSVNELYEINYSGALFATRRLEVDLHPDCTVKRAKITSTSTASDDLSALAEATKAVGESVKAMKEAQAPPPLADPLDAENTALQQQILNLMLEANLRALQAGEPIPYPDVG